MKPSESSKGETSVRTQPEVAALRRAFCFASGVRLAEITKILAIVSGLCAGSARAATTFHDEGLFLGGASGLRWSFERLTDPDASSSLLMLGCVLVGLGTLRRLMIQLTIPCTYRNGCQDTSRPGGYFRRFRAHPVRMLMVAWLAAISLFMGPNAHGDTSASNRPFLSAQVMDQIAAVGREKESWTPTQRKIGSKLLLASKRQLQRPMVAGVPATRFSPDTDDAGRVLVDIKSVVSDRLLTRIQSLGGLVINHSARYSSIRAALPMAQLEALAAESEVISIRPADKAFIQKVDTSEGVVAHRADSARTTFGVTGAGVKVGVISDSAQALASLQASGDLPAGVTILPGQAGSGTSEGTAMMEIVHDIAPGASLFFATANGGQAQFAQNILDLHAAGCNIIVDDVGYFAEPVFQDGIIAQAAETVARAGTSYFSSAGNSGNLDDGTAGVWEGDFVPIAGSGPLSGRTVHDFGSGVNFNTITSDSPSVFTLQWSDPSGGSANDYDLFLLNSTRSIIFDSSVDSQTGTQDPFEAIDSSSFNDTGNVLVIVRFSGSGRYLHLNANRGRFSATTAGQTWGHSAAASAFSVAAVNVAAAGGGVFVGGTSNPVETFSSDGPRQVFYAADGTPITPGNFSSTGGTVRQKPDIAAADGVSTATPGFKPFFGTSAAAPHAAGVAALMFANGLTTPAQIRLGMTRTALDIEAAGVDRDSGAGIVNALAAVGFAVSPVVTVVATDASAGEPGTGQGTGTLTFTRTGSTAAALTVNFTVGGTATSGSDYTSIGTSVSFAAGSSTATRTVSALDDLLVESNETLVVTLAAGAGYSLGAPSSATITIQDDESTVTVVATDPLAGEPGASQSSGTFTFTRTGFKGGALTVNFTVGGTATSGSDYTSIGTNVAFAAGSSNATKTVSVLDDLLVETNETVIVTLAPKAGYVIGSPSSATVTIQDDEPTVTVVATDATAGEPGTGSGTGTFHFSRTGPTNSSLTVNFAQSGTATSGSDFNSIGTTVTIPAGSSSANKTVTAIDDSSVEANETVIVTLAAGTGYAIASPNTATVTIRSDDLPVITMSASDATAGEPGTGSGNGTFRFSRSGPTTSTLTVNFTVGGTATSGSDYTSIGTNVTFAAGSSNATKTVSVLDDLLVETNETVIVTLAPKAGYVIGSPSSATVTIQDDEPTVTVVATDATAGEPGTGSGTGTFHFSRTGPTNSSLTVNFAQSGTATSGSDFNSIGTTVTIPAGSSSANKTVTAIDDSSVEANETVIVTLAAGTGYAIASPNTATVTIRSDDLPVITMSASDATAGEPGTGSGNGTFRFSRSGPTTSTLTVNFTVGGTATSGSDYTSIGTNVTFAAGSSNATKTVSVLDDLLVETNETVIVTLAPKAGYVIGSPSSATVTIQSDDPPVTPQLAIQVVSEVGNPQGSWPSDAAMTTSKGCMVHLRVYGPAGQPCQIFASEDLKDWTVIGEAVPDAAGWVDFADPDAATHAKRFYRVGSQN